MIALVFLYFTSLIFVYGGEFNFAVRNLSNVMRAQRKVTPKDRAFPG
jgi:uncharacterized BrkB/YihY/UPF0761 family membrane protein